MEGCLRSAETERLTALNAAVAAFLADRDARNDALVARQELARRCIDAHAYGWSDQQIANAFKRAATDALSRTRIQQIRSQGEQS